MSYTIRYYSYKCVGWQEKKSKKANGAYSKNLKLSGPVSKNKFFPKYYSLFFLRHDKLNKENDFNFIPNLLFAT